MLLRDTWRHVLLKLLERNRAMNIVTVCSHLKKLVRNKLNQQSVKNNTGKEQELTGNINRREKIDNKNVF